MIECTPWPALRVVYALNASTVAEREQRIESLLLEQTVELPRHCLRDPFVLEQMVGRLVAVEPLEETRYRVTLDFPLGAIGEDPAQFLNVLFGNSSLQSHLELLDFSWPGGWPTRSRALPGPHWGSAGLRQALGGVMGRALTSTALKPIGLSVARLAELAGLFARAGIDLIKDDHGLANQPFHPFTDRVRACQAAVEAANRETGRQSIYVPNLIGTPATVREQLRFAQAEGVGGVMVAPMLLGLPSLAELVEKEARVPVIAHPSLGGASRIAPEVLYGKLFPLYGADATIFVNFGGRFASTREACGRIARELTHPSSAGMLPTFPMPAGGIGYEQVSDVLEFYGRDVILLLGAGLYAAGDDAALQLRAEEFVEKVAQAGTIGASL